MPPPMKNESAFEFWSKAKPLPTLAGAGRYSTPNLLVMPSPTKPRRYQLQHGSAAGGGGSGISAARTAALAANETIAASVEIFSRAMHMVLSLIVSTGRVSGGKVEERCQQILK